jgi:alkyl sulfatase BDS1-like metallo-beta-lactamase superfamily hydrolase
MPKERGANGLFEAIGRELSDGVDSLDYKEENPLEIITIEDKCVVYDVDSIEINKLAGGDTDVTFHVSLIGNAVESLVNNSNFNNRKILKADDGINTTITFGDQVWYVLMGEYNFNYSVEPKEPLQMNGEIRVFDAKRVE